MRATERGGWSPSIAAHHACLIVIAATAAVILLIGSSSFLFKAYLGLRGEDSIAEFTRPASGHSVTYRKHYGPMLEALTRFREGLDAERLAFLVQAWKAAYAKAKELGWLLRNRRQTLGPTPPCCLSPRHYQEASRECRGSNS